MRFMPLFFVVLIGCAEFPALDGTISDAARAAPYPTLTQLPQSTTIESVVDAGLSARVAALQARAARLRQIDIAALQ
ncbi:hypothetical protein [Yoonia sp. I 8.24]|uniref:hypothetical protein n=1 Tax=Yoonia sp. I 8.24 TaxID=1537229 RepID=UPI001EDEE21E|nr:hypothetical protein [Yoonia sp. I 8.24]MCG3268878.1 hypothetical protein [Yoonia sp. I 8.24]